MLSSKVMTIAQNSFKLFTALLIGLLSFTSFASAEASGEHKEEAHAEQGPGQIDTPEEVQSYIEHHLQDSHDFTFFTDGETGKHYGFPLPVILIDGGVQMFMSSKFDHGHKVAEHNGNFYKLYHGKIYKTDAAGTIDYDAEHHPLNEKPFDISLTKSAVGMLLAAFLLIFMFGRLAKGYKKGVIPTGFGRVLEPLVIYVRDEIARPNIGEKKYKKFMSYLLTVFFFIWILNLLGMTPLGFNVTGQIAVTMCLALFTFIIVQINGNKDYWGHIFWMPGVPVIMKILLIPVEVLGMFTKPFSLMIRLFANMTAGHFVVMSLVAIMVLLKQDLSIGGSTAMSIVLTLFISLIELLVAFLQAYIFTMLSSLFIGMAVAEHDHH
jgi:F-type H+-transporting ATPase subunit a